MGPFENMAMLVGEVHDRLIPYAIRRRYEIKHGEPPPWLHGAMKRLHERLLLRICTDDLLRAWLHERAGMGTWRALDYALMRLYSVFVNAEADSPLARRLTPELVATRTAYQVVMVALRLCDGQAPPCG